MQRRLITIPCGGRPFLYDMTESMAQDVVDCFKAEKVEGVMAKYQVSRSTAYRLVRRARTYEQEE